MAINIGEALNQGVEGQPGLYRALLATVPVMRRVTLTPALIAGNTTAEQLFTVTGVQVGDNVQVNKPTAQAGIGIVGARVSAANQIGITFGNFTAGNLTPTAAEVYSVLHSSAIAAT